MIRVLIESPYGSRPDGSRCSNEELLRNEDYMMRAMLDSLDRGEAPFASHAMYPLVLDDANPGERRTGMEAGFCWGETAELIAVYMDYDVTPGMAEGIARWSSMEKKIEYRKIGENP